MNERVVYHTGDWVPVSKAGIHIYDSQSFFGDGIFEMVRTFNQEYFILEKHIDRLFRSADYLQMTICYTKQEIIELCREILERNKEHFPEGEEVRLYINASRGPLPMYGEVFDKLEPPFIIDAWPLSKTAKNLGHFYETGANAVVPVQRQIPARLLENKVKNVSRMHYQVANIEVSNFNFGKDTMPLMLDEDGFVTKCNGDVETLVGIVTDYDVKILPNGSVECSLTMTSKNSALMQYPKHVGGDKASTNAKFEFDLDNLILYEQTYNLGGNLDRTRLTLGLDKVANSDMSVENELGYETFMNETKWRSYGSKSFVPTAMAMISGLFVVGDEVPTNSYIQWGFLEDRIFNRYFGHGDDSKQVSEDKEMMMQEQQNQTLLEQAGQFANAPLADPSKQQPPMEQPE